MKTPDQPRRRVKQVVFSKEDIITKKKLTKFLLGYDIRFQPDQHHRGNYEAVIKIQGFNKPEKAQKQTGNSNSPQQTKLDTSNLQLSNSTEKKPPPVYLKSAEMEEIEDRATSQLKRNIQLLSQQVGLLNSHLEKQGTKNDRLIIIKEEVEHKILQQSNLLLLYQFIRTSIYRKFRGSPISRFTLSLFMVILYYYYLSNEQEFMIDQHNIIVHRQEESDERREPHESIQLVELNHLVKLFDSIFLQTKFSKHEVDRKLYQSFINLTNERCKSPFQLTQFKATQMIYDSAIFRSRLAQIMSKNIKHELTFGEELGLKATQKKQKKTPSPTPETPSHIKSKSQKPSKPISQKSPSAKSLSFMSQQEKSTQTFRPSVVQEHTQTNNYIPPQETPLTEIQDLEKKFKKIVKEQLQQYQTSQWIRELHVKKKYRELSPKTVETNYKAALNQLFLDKLDQLSTEELMVYYDFMLKRARNLYVTFLREKKVHMKTKPDFQ